MRGLGPAPDACAARRRRVVRGVVLVAAARDAESRRTLSVRARCCWPARWPASRRSVVKFWKVLFGASLAVATLPPRGLARSFPPSHRPRDGFPAAGRELAYRTVAMLDTA